MAKEDIYGADPVDHALSLADSALDNPVVLDIHGVHDERVAVTPDKTMDKEIHTSQTGGEEAEASGQEK